MLGQLIGGFVVIIIAIAIFPSIQEAVSLAVSDMNNSPTSEIIDMQDWNYTYTHNPNQQTPNKLVSNGTDFWVVDTKDGFVYRFYSDGTNRTETKLENGDMVTFDFDVYAVPITTNDNLMVNWTVYFEGDYEEISVSDAVKRTSTFFRSSAQNISWGATMLQLVPLFFIIGVISIVIVVIINVLKSSGLLYKGKDEDTEVEKVIKRCLYPSKKEKKKISTKEVPSIQVKEDDFIESEFD